MVRRVWQNRLVSGVSRVLRLFLRWLLVWLTYLVRQVGRTLMVSGRILTLLARPRDPNNLFVAGQQASYQAPETSAFDLPDIGEDTKRPTLLWTAGEQANPVPEQPLDTSAISLWRGARRIDPAEAESGAAVANRRFAYIDLLGALLKRLKPSDMEELDALVQRLARKWLDIDESFETYPRRNKLDVRRTLRYNIPRYAGRILNFQWAVKEIPVPHLAKPARILVIGDVSHSMVHYVSIVLYFFHKLHFRFAVDSYVFSERASHSSPFLNGPGSFEEKVQRLIAGAKSWNAGTRFGTALEEIAADATVDEYTYVVIATDGKVSLVGDECTKIERCMRQLRSRARQVIFLTPSAEFSDGSSGKTKPERLGSFKYDFYDIPIFSMGPPLWYGTLAEYADRLYLVRTVQDLIDMTEDLILASRD